MEPPSCQESRRHLHPLKSPLPSEPTSTKTSPQLLARPENMDESCVAEPRPFLRSEAERDTSQAERVTARSSGRTPPSADTSAQATDKAQASSHMSLAAQLPQASPASGLLELLEEGWFKENVVWFGSRWLALSTIKESPNEAEEQGEEGEAEEERAASRDSTVIVEGDVTEDQGCPLSNLREGRGSVQGTRGLNPCPAHPWQGYADSGEAPSRLPLDLDAGRSGAWTSSPYSSDEDSAHNQRRGRPRGRSGQRHRTRRSSSAENAQETRFRDVQEGLGHANLSRRLRGLNTPPHEHSRGAQPVDEHCSPEHRQSERQFLRTRSVSDYEGNRPHLWGTPPGARPKSSSLTDADVEELQGFVDLGFKFEQSRVNPQITATLPALRLYQAVGSVQQRIMAQRHGTPASLPADPAASFSVPASQCLSSENFGDLGGHEISASPPNEVPWSIAHPSDNPVEMKNTLRLWAQAVASTVRQTC